MNDYQKYIQQLKMQAHPEGGWYAETYRSELQKEFPEAGIPKFRNLCTAIYFLLPEGKFSAFHRIKSDEIWHHYDGGILHIAVIYPDGKLEVLKLGKDFHQACRPQHIVPAGAWFASYPERGSGFVLCGCTVAPGFDFDDFEMAGREQLITSYPQHKALISLLTYANKD
jgi:predicted cupin superfamily sugar epimerase